jgi:hypothetical protein
MERSTPSSTLSLLRARPFSVRLQNEDKKLMASFFLGLADLISLP